MDGKLTILKCEKCSFYFSCSNSNEFDYNKYYSTHNNYSTPTSASTSKNEKCSYFLFENLDSTVNTVVDYGCGNGQLSDLLMEKYEVTRYDVGYPDVTNQYDCLVLSHVLEHIYNPKSFINSVSKYIRDGGYIYIEVPNAEKYEVHGNTYGPLQEINIEHINFFSPYSLTKLLIDLGFMPEKIKECAFTLSGYEYPVIRGLFKKRTVSMSFERYLDIGSNYLSTLETNLPEINGRVFLYGCGQLLYKVIPILQKKYNIINIADDNNLLINKTLNGINIISTRELTQGLTSDDTVIVTSSVHFDRIKLKLLSLNVSSSIIPVAV
jgi:SAM-dependent methyltransferase